MRVSCRQRLAGGNRFAHLHWSAAIYWSVAPAVRQPSNGPTRRLPTLFDDVATDCPVGNSRRQPAASVMLFRSVLVLLIASCSLVFCKPPKQQLGRGRGGFNRGNNPFDTPSITGDGDNSDSDDYVEVSSAMPRLPEPSDDDDDDSRVEEATGTVAETSATTAATMSALATTADAVESEQTPLTDANEEEELGELAPTTEWAGATESTEEAHEEAQETTPSQLSPRMSDTDRFNKLLEKGYDWRVRPPGTNLSYPGTNGPVVVSVNILIRSISKIDDVNMEYSAQLTFRENWVDGRLAYGLSNDKNPEFLILPPGQKIWMPDTFFQNEKRAHKHIIDKPNVLIRIYKDGTILYSVRISLVLSCPMHLKYYPMDVQNCLIDLASYAYTEDDIKYIWKEENPIQLKAGLNSSLPSFELADVSTSYCTSTTNTGTYSCLRTTLVLRRQFSYYLLQLYLPSTMLVIVSWVSFWLDRSAVPARVTLGVTTLLTMTTQASGINAKLPPVSYTKAIDIWIGACLTFIFGALLEFAWVTYIGSHDFYKGRPVLTGPTPGMTPAATPNPSFRKPAGKGFASRFRNPLISQSSLTMRAGQPYLPRLDETFLAANPLTTNMSSTRTGTPTSPQSPPIWVPQDAKEGEEQEQEPTAVVCCDHSYLSPQGDESEAPMIPLANMLPPQMNKPYPENRRRRRGLGHWLWRHVTRVSRIKDRSKRTDYVSRFLFPALFSVFNVLYWTTYSSYQVSVPT
uniref:Uncharacterized protein n=1 Tax=Plectus sambesii TaxID=2011161 RepID=A0A914WL87_9BILA